ncbi:response regulator [Halonotius sp. GCM10025705]|uniref:response regulator n=1 Tax=Halonotius sp. GCM10025705 TaxID=3252678 RepID=UPI00360DF41D
MTSNQIRVLHVDDDPHFGKLVADRLGREADQITVQAATTPEEGLSILTTDPVDCILSDYEMPAQDGLEFLETIRDDYPDLPFILYTSRGSEEVASEAISAGVTDYLQKDVGPSHYELLSNRITNAVSQYRAQKELTRNEDLLASTERLANTGGWELDVQTGDTHWTDGTYAIYGLDPDAELTKQEAIEFYYPDDRGEIKRLVERCIDTGESYEATLRLIDADDQIRWVHTNGEAIRKNGEIVAIRGAIQDITDLKESQEHPVTAENSSGRRRET